MSAKLCVVPRVNSHWVLSFWPLFEARSICVIDVQRDSLYGPWRLIGREALLSRRYRDRRRVREFFDGEMTRVWAWGEMRQEVGWTCRSEEIPATGRHANPHPVFVRGAQWPSVSREECILRDREIMNSWDICCEMQFRTGELISRRVFEKYKTVHFVSLHVAYEICPPFAHFWIPLLRFVIGRDSGGIGILQKI